LNYVAHDPRGASETIDRLNKEGLSVHAEKFAVLPLTVNGEQAFLYSTVVNSATLKFVVSRLTTHEKAEKQSDS
jgi:hypothetical protein